MTASVCIVCVANFCRSPVAEKLIQKYYPNITDVSSAGLNPMPAANMDRRSMQFLKKRNIQDLMHTPKNISNKVINKYDEIYALDFSILFELNKQYPKFSNKIKLLSYKDPSINLSDPYKMNNEDYFKIMEKIDLVCSNLYD